MLQWMGGARRKINTTKDSKLKRQRDFFDHRKEKRRKNELGGEAGNPRKLSDYIRQNLHGGESLDILGLRSLNSTTTEGNTSTNPNAGLLAPATGVTVATSIVNTSSTVDALKEDDQDTSSQQPECTTRSRGIIKESKQQRLAYPQQVKKTVNRNTELRLPERKIPVQVGNLQTKKVASPAPGLRLLDMISSDIKGDSRGKRRSPSEAYAVFSLDGINAIDESIPGQVVEYPQHTNVTSDSVGDWGDTKQLLTSSLQLKNSCDSHPVTEATGTSDLLSRFLSTQKLKDFGSKSSRQHGKKHDRTKDPLLESQSLLNSFRVVHNDRQNLDFSNPTFNLTNVQVKQESRQINFPNPMFNMENFHMNEESQEFKFSDPFVNIIDQQERQEYEYLNSVSISDQEYPFLPDLSYDRSVFKVESRFSEHKKVLESPENDPVIWDSDSRWNISTTAPNLKRKFPTLDHQRPVQVSSCGRSRNNGLRQSGICEFYSADPEDREMRMYLDTSDVNEDNIPDTIENFCPLLENRETARMNFEKLRLPLDVFEVERKHIEATFSSLDDFSPRQMKTNSSNFVNESPDWSDDVGKPCTFAEQCNCDPSLPWGVPRSRENIDPAHSGGNSGLNEANSWSETVDGENFLNFSKFESEEGLAADFADYLTDDISVMQGKDPSSETLGTTASEILQDIKPKINNGNEDFIIVCFPAHEACPTVDVNTIHLPIQSINIPLQVFGALESSSGTGHDIKVLSSAETPSKRISQEIDGSLVSGKEITAARVKTTVQNELLLRQEDSACDVILTRNSHKSRKHDALFPTSLSVLGKGTEDLSWQIKEPQREVYCELQTPKIRSSSSNLLPTEKKTVEENLEHHRSNCDKADQCSSSNVLYDHAIRHKTTPHAEGNLLEVCTLKGLLQEDVNDMSTTKAAQKQLRTEDAHDHGGRASLSSQEEWTPACQLNKVQTLICKLQRPPVDSCGSKQGKYPEHGTRNVDTVLFKLQRPTSPSQHGFGHQDPQGNQTPQKDIKQTSDMNQKSNSESNFKPTVECGVRLLAHLNISGSRGSVAFPKADRCYLERSTPKSIGLSSEEEGEERGLSEISKQRDKETRLSLEDDINAIASTDHRVSNRSHQRVNQISAHSLPSELQIKKVPKFSVTPARDIKNHSPPVSQRNVISAVPEEEQPSPRVSDPPAPHSDALDPPSNIPPVSERQVVVEPSQEQTEFFQGPNNIQQNLWSGLRQVPATEDFKHETTTYDADYVKMLESYVVQLKLENNALRLWTCS